ncbi:MAG: alpha-mannosidase, partial [Pseudothermotoga sp.]|nr:alpha-mannosidase [Pseudothermotoga sp.]
EGYHELTYSVYLHGKCDVKDFYKKAEKLNNKIKVFFGLPKDIKYSLEIQPDHFRILSLKNTQDKIYLRLLENVGSTTNAKIKINGKINAAYLVDVLENRWKKLDFFKNTIIVEFKPFKFHTVELEK